MNEIIKIKLDKDFEKDDFEYFFTLLSERFDYLNNLWIKELGKKFNKKFKPIFILNAKRNEFFDTENYIIINERLSRLQKKLKKKKIIFQSEQEDLNKEFSSSKLIRLLINKLVLKQGRVFILSWTTSGLFLNNSKVIILGPDPKIAAKYDNKIEHIKLFQKLNLTTNKVKIYENLSEVEKIDKKHYPFFLSASFSSGGQESKIIRSLRALRNFSPWFRGVNRNNRLIVAKLIKNIKLFPNSSAMVMGKNKTKILCISDQIMHGLRYMGNIYPSKVDRKNRKVITDATVKTGNYLSRQGFRGIFGCDFLIDRKDKCYIIDLNPRRQGGYLCNVLMLKVKEINVIEIELKLALGEKVSPAVLKELSIDYAWAHSKIKPLHSNYWISSVSKFGGPADPFLKPGSIFRITFFPKNYLYTAGAAGCCIVSALSRNEVKSRIGKISREMTIKHFKLNRKLPKYYFDSQYILNLLK